MRACVRDRESESERENVCVCVGVSLFVWVCWGLWGGGGERERPSVGVASRDECRAYMCAMTHSYV